MTSKWRETLEQVKDAKGISDADIVRATKLNPSYMNKVMRKGVTPSVTNLAKIAHAVGLTLGELYEGDTTSKPIIQIMGQYVGSDRWVSVDSRSAKHITLNILGEDVVAVEIATDDWAPRYGRGDIVCGHKSSQSNVHNLIGRDCIIETQDGDRLIKYIIKGSRKNRYHVRSLMPAKGELEDLAIKWAAPITLVLRGE